MAASHFGLLKALILIVALAPAQTTIAADAIDATLATDGVYRLEPGDRLRITVFNEPTLTGEYVVTAEGSISFPLIGDVPARGSSMTQVRDVLRTRLADGYLNDPRIAVEPVNYRPYYILGEVNRPGEYPYSVGLKIEQAVAAAGGYTYRANRRTAFLRRTDDAQEKRVNVRKQIVRVLPGDTIRIGERYF
jgi:polysaccharide biosynthesis/export protein